MQPRSTSYFVCVDLFFLVLHLTGKRIYMIIDKIENNNFKKWQNGQEILILFSIIVPV